MIELTPYIMQLATMRTNSEGSWWIIWNFAAADVQSGAVTIPTTDPGYLTTTVPTLQRLTIWRQRCLLLSLTVLYIHR